MEFVKIFVIWDLKSVKTKRWKNKITYTCSHANNSALSICMAGIESVSETIELDTLQ